VALLLGGLALGRPPRSGTTPLLGLGLGDAPPEPPAAAVATATAPAEPAAEPEDPAAAAARAKPSLRGELRAIATLYAIQSVLPFVIGTIFAA
jgi:hypothetical protein